MGCLSCTASRCAVLSFYFHLKRKLLLQKIEWELVKVAPLGKSLGYDLLIGDPGVYSDGGDFDGFCPDRG